MSERIGVIGLGRMGWALAARLSSQGLEVRGWTRSGADPAKATNDGFAVLANLDDLVAASDVLILSLFDEAAVRNVLAILASQDLSEKLVVETSTVPPQVVRDCEEAVISAGGRLIDAPISGGPEMVAAGTIGLFIGGAESDVERFWDIGEAASDRMVHVGMLGAGAASKIVNYVALAGAFQSTLEALRMGNRMGLDLDVMLAFLENSPGTTPMFKARIAKVRGEDNAVGFSVDGANKDAGLFNAVAKALGEPVWALDGLAHSMQDGVEAGLGEYDVAILVKHQLGIK
ncbi:MAG: NAD(P)-dependent oxidoreductase, partial [Boseongicola sp.]